MVSRCPNMSNTCDTGISLCEDSHTLRLTSELVDLRVANANPCVLCTLCRSYRVDKIKKALRMQCFLILVSQLQSKSNISLHSKISIPLVIATVVRSYAVWRNHRDIARRFQSRTREFCFAEPWHRPRCIRLQAPRGSFLPPHSAPRADSQS